MKSNILPIFPPLLRGEKVPAHIDPFLKARAIADCDVDPGLIVWSDSDSMLRSSILLNPQMELQQALCASYVVMMGLADSLGALGPPELAVQFEWPNRIIINGAQCGQVRTAANVCDPEAEPNWLVIGIEIPFLPGDDKETGYNPESTTLYAEGCSSIRPIQLLESWSKHTLVWMNRFLDDGFQPVHDAWRSKCNQIGQVLEGYRSGIFVGLDDTGNLLCKKNGITEVYALHDLMEKF